MAALSAAIAPRRPGRAGARQQAEHRRDRHRRHGRLNLQACEGENVALCDVDEVYSAKTRARCPKAAFYNDYRVVLEKEKGIDAVIVATPDHAHATITMALREAGKHVCRQKPLTHTVHEARTITEVARGRRASRRWAIRGSRISRRHC
jgi:predicted dehydrogenase